MNKNKIVYLLTYRHSAQGRDLSPVNESAVIGVYGDTKTAKMDMMENVRSKKVEMETEYRLDGVTKGDRIQSMWYLDKDGNCYEYIWCITPFMVKGEVK